LTDLTQATAEELSRLYQSGAASPVTVAHQVLAKIERVNPVLNAFCFTDPATTLSQAQASAQRWKNSQPLSELDGVPVAVKDSILTQGWPTLNASRAVDPTQSWDEDAPAVARLREAGAVFVGKTTMSEFGSTEYHSDSLLYGNVYNPRNINYTPGGSSGGSAVAVAAGLVPVALGTDFGGSIAVPSAFCGVFGMRPSTGRVPQWPVDALELSTVGPMARSMADIELVMNIIVKPDIRDGTSLPYDRAWNDLTIKDSLHGKKIACVELMKDVKILDYLTSQGAQINFISLDIDFATKIFIKLSELKMLQQWVSVPKQLQASTSRLLQRRAILAHSQKDTYLQLNNRHKLITHMRTLMQSYDFILGPATVIKSGQRSALLEHVSPLSIFFCLTKQPTITVPIGLDNTGMPISVMIAGAMHDDIGILQVARAMEKQFPMPHPPLFYSKGSLCKKEILKKE
jgi:aspartyl-tRNA(Asn)/glutamyl-tRNA(Gln) amidotransferase subunit A